MNKQVCKYSIIRFQPYAETEEFANIGVVLYATTTNRLEFRLLESKQHTRITHFFDPLCKDAFVQTVKIIHYELDRLKNLLDNKTQIDLYEELIRSREDIIRFSDNRVIFSHDPIVTVDKLFEHYVHHNFIHEPTYEDVMKSKVKALLLSHNLGSNYKESKIGEQNRYEVLFPFVRDFGDKKAIKPIHFQHDKPTPLIEHGIKWLSKVQQLQKYRFIKPQQILFAYNAPDSNQPTLFTAFNEIKEQADRLGVVMLDIKSEDEIARFASS